MGWAESSESSLSERGKCSCVVVWVVPPTWRVGDLLLTGKRLNNYKLIIFISTKGFTWPVRPDVIRSVCRGRLEASMVFLSVPKSSPWRWGGWHSRRFMESVLWDTGFTWLLRLLGLVLQGVILSCNCNRRWRLLGEGKLPSHRYLMECWPSRYLRSRYRKPPGAAPERMGVSRAVFWGWVVIGVHRYSGYRTPTVAFEPFVEQAVKAVRSAEGRIGSHMLLRVPSQDRVMTMDRRGMTRVVMCDRSWDLWQSWDVPTL
jgi:hypothetical protein